jgi:DNA relaxase NicK
MSIGNVKKIMCQARRSQQDPNHRSESPLALTEDQEADIVQNILHCTSGGIFMKKSELLDQIESVYKKVLTFGWVHHFVT